MAEVFFVVTKRPDRVRPNMKSTVNGELVCFKVKKDLEKHLAWKVEMVPIRRFKPRSRAPYEDFPVGREKLGKMEDDMADEAFDVAMFVLELTRSAGGKSQRVPAKEMACGMETIAENAKGLHVEATLTAPGHRG
jgi:hypothetical protein